MGVLCVVERAARLTVLAGLRICKAYSQEKEAGTYTCGTILGGQIKLARRARSQVVSNNPINLRTKWLDGNLESSAQDKHAAVPQIT